MKQKSLQFINYKVVGTFLFVICMTLMVNLFYSSPSQASNQTTCNIKPGFKVYYILKNGKLGKRDYSIGSTRERSYTCIKDRYYHRILMNGKWRYVSVDAENSADIQHTNVDEAHPTTEEQDAEGIDNISGEAPDLSRQGNLTHELSLKPNFNIRNEDGSKIGSSFGIDSSKQNVQVKLSAPNTPIVNSDGLVNVQYNFINSRGRSESIDAWISPEAIINYDQTIASNNSGSSDSGSTSSASTDSSNDYDLDNPNRPKAGDQIHILPGIEALIPKTQPFLASAPMDDVKPLSPGSEIIATGNRKCDRDSKKCFVEVEFSDDTDGEFVGWIDEQQTNVNPTYHLSAGTSGAAMALPADSDELGVAEGNRTLVNNENWYEERFSPEERASHERLFEMLRTMPKPMNFETNRGLIRLHNDRRGFCGSYHYATESNPRVGASDEIQTYAKPVTACGIARLAQTWKKYHCPDGGNSNGCRLSTGDISDRTLKKFDGHKSHTDGECFDIRPMRKSGVGPLDYNSGSYDRAKTRELLKVLKSLGGTNIFFNDPQLRKEGLASYAGGHHNHIHVCFKQSTPAVRNSCSNYSPDYEVCPELRSLFNAPLMQQFKK